MAVSYEHAITGAMSRTKDDFLGGILADDMGMGKSLTMLSAIIASSAQATGHADIINSSTMPLQGEAKVTFLHTTLVVVHSECTCEYLLL